MEYIGISLQEYFIKNSGIDRQFIRDYIAIQNSDLVREYYPFIIDTELIVKWLQMSNKGALTQTLYNSYIENKDYIIMLPIDVYKQTHEKQGGHNKQTILVTKKCFKKICIKTNSVISDQIADYYIALEELTIDYQDYIIAKLLEENKLLKNDLNNETIPKTGVFYIIDLGNGYYKIGITNNFKQRKQIYETGMIHKAKVVSKMETNDRHALERCVKAFITKFAIKKRKEVYMVPLDKILGFANSCSRIITGQTCDVCNDKQLDENLHQHFKRSHKDMLKRMTIVNSKYIQHGGTNDIDDNQIDYYAKYIKYKRKYLDIKTRT
jgi:hypothetical protein